VVPPAKIDIILKNIIMITIIIIISSSANIIIIIIIIIKTTRDTPLQTNPGNGRGYPGLMFWGSDQQS